MELLPDLLTQIEPIDPGLARIYKGLPDEVLANEGERLRQQFLDTGAKIVAISQIQE